MGVSFIAIFESIIPPDRTIGDDTRSIVRQQKRLDRLAETNGLTPLGAFESYAPEDFEGLMDEDDNAISELPPAQWFDPADGLKAIAELATFLNAHPDAVPEQTFLLEDLSDLKTDLADAQAPVYDSGSPLFLDDTRPVLFHVTLGKTLQR